MKKVLIVEDDQIVANIYRNKFAVDGFQVEVALDGHAGLELVRQFRPDAIILDLMLPRMSGVDFMKHVRAQPDFHSVPIIVFSNTYLTNMVQEAWKAGATKCLSKANCTPRQVIEVVRGTIGSANLEAGVAANTGSSPAGTAFAAAPATRSSNVATVNLPASASAAQGDADAEFTADLRKSFIESLPATLATLRALLKGLIKADSEMARLKQVHELYRRIHALTGNAG